MHDILPLKPSRNRRRSILYNTRSAHTWQHVNLEASVDPTVVRAAPKKSEDTPRPLSAWELAMLTTGIPSSLWEPGRWGNSPVHRISYFNLITFTWFAEWPYIRDYMDRRVTTLTRDPPPSCQQALKLPTFGRSKFRTRIKIFKVKQKYLYLFRSINYFEF